MLTVVFSRPLRRMRMALIRRPSPKSPGILQLVEFDYDTTWRARRESAWWAGVMQAR